MKELFEFRLYENEARSILKDTEGKVLPSGLARLVRTNGRDSLFSKLRTVAKTRSVEGRHFVSSWQCVRRYAKKELSEAHELLLLIPRVFEPSGEECGTTYDGSAACGHCGLGAVQGGPLRLQISSVPRVDIARTIGGEIVVSSRFRNLVEATGLKGLALEPVEAIVDGSRRGQPIFQLRTLDSNLRIASPPSAFGISPFDEDESGEYRCPLGHVLGLNRLSELTVRSGIPAPNDIVTTREAAGTRRGLLRPERFLVVSQRFYSAVVDGRLDGFRFEVVHRSLQSKK